MSNFESEKHRVITEYQSTLLDGKIDPKAIPVLDVINANAKYYSTSSCSGRILLLAVARPGAKHDSRMLYSWHEPVTSSEVDACIKTWNEHAYLYFLAQSPIFHITTYDLQAAIDLRNLGDSAGLKYSAIRSIKSITSGKPSVS